MSHKILLHVLIVIRGPTKAVLHKVKLATVVHSRHDVKELNS